MTIASNTKWAAASQLGRLATQFFGMVVLARILGPGDFGMMAMALVVAALAAIFRDLGTGAAIIQREQLSAGAINLIFWFNLSLGIATAALVLLVAAWIERVFGAAGLQNIVALLALSFPFAAASIVHLALLERACDFKALAFIELTSALIGTGSAVAAAFYGLGVYSLVVQSVGTVLVSTAQLWWRSRWRPAWALDRSQLASIVRFSGPLGAFQLLNFLIRNADNAIIGTQLGSLALGLYSMAYKFMMLIVQNITFTANRAVFPVISREQGSPPRKAEIYLGLVANVSLASAPAAALLFAAREPLLAGLLGRPWGACADILVWLAPTAFVQSIVSTSGPVFMVEDRTALLARLGLLGVVVNVLAVYAGARVGVVEVARLYFFANVLVGVPCLLICLRLLKIGVPQLLRALLPAMAGAVLVVIVVKAGSFLLHRWEVQATLAQLCVLLPLGLIAYVGLLRSVGIDLASRIDRVMRV